MKRTSVTVVLILCAAAALADASGADGLTSIPGIRVGHHTLSQRPTGCTVVLTESGAVAGVDVRGSAPGTREVALLAPVNTVQEVHAVVLTGGSAFGLDSVSGVVRYLEEKNVGFDVRIARVPIVPAAVLFDLGVGGKPEIRPGPECGYQAAKAATTGDVTQGNVGAGAGATVGKSAGPGRAMKGGIGSAAIELPNGLIVAALMAVNAVGDIVDPSTGEIVAGVRGADGSGLADVRELLRSGALLSGRTGGNTTIGVVATNAALTKTEANKVAQMAHDGLARAIVPAHTPFDGDTIFALSLGSFDGEANLSMIGALAAEAVADAILRAVENAQSIPGFPAASDYDR